MIHDQSFVRFIANGNRFCKRVSFKFSRLPIYYGLRHQVPAYFLPAAGWRNNDANGALNNRGTNGYYWSSTQSGSNGGYLNFNSGNANMNNTNRTYGFSVRCVAALNIESCFYPASY